MHFAKTENAQRHSGEICIGRSFDVFPEGLIVQEIPETKHSTSSILHMIILQWDYLLFTSIPLGKPITCQASFINRTLSRWAIAKGKQENKFIYIISSFRVETVFSIYMNRNCQNSSERGRKVYNYSKMLRKTQKTSSLSF